MTQASVGFHCPECTVSGRQQVHRGPIVIDPVATKALLVVNVAISLAVIVSGGGALPAAVLLDFGLAGPPLDVNGEAYRILTSGVLHDGLFHLGVNMYSLWIVGPLVERALGAPGSSPFTPRRSSLDPSARCSSIRSASPLARQGDLRTVRCCHRRRARLSNRDIGNRLGAIVGINLVLTFAVPVLSIGGHVGGLLGGVALAGAFVPQVRAKRPEWESIAVAMLLVAFFAAGASGPGRSGPTRSSRGARPPDSYVSRKGADRRSHERQMTWADGPSRPGRGIERGAGPCRPPARPNEPDRGGGCIELLRGQIANDPRPHPVAIGSHLDVMPSDDLRIGVVFGDGEHGGVGGDVAHGYAAVGHAVLGWDESLDDEDAAWREKTEHALQTATLVVGCDEVEEGVEGCERNRVRAGGGNLLGTRSLGKVGHVGEHRSDGVGARLVGQQTQHRRRRVDPDARTPAAASGIASRPVPTPSSSTGPSPANRAIVATVASTSLTSAYQSS